MLAQKTSQGCCRFSLLAYETFVYMPFVHHETYA
jgi:hypothetical protein